MSQDPLRQACEAVVDQIDELARAHDQHEFGLPCTSGERTMYIKIVMSLVKAQRADVWEKAATLIEDGIDVSYECGPGNLKTFKSNDPKTIAAKCREQRAKELE